MRGVIGPHSRRLTSPTGEVAYLVVLRLWLIWCSGVFWTYAGLGNAAEWLEYRIVSLCLYLAHVAGAVRRWSEKRALRRAGLVCERLRAAQNGRTLEQERQVRALYPKNPE